MLKSPLFQKLIVIVLLILASTLLSKLSPENSSIKSSEQNSQSAVNGTNAKASVRNYKTNNSQLPKEASETLNLILSNGPFPYEKDGTVFRNRENRLPHKPRDYYREYTVKTPGSRDRGARRIVRGNSGELYYTSDHYQTFEPIRPP